MTEQEAIEILKRDLKIQKENKALPDGIIAMEIAIKALEKQMAKKPICDDKDSFIRLHHCPVCNLVVTRPQRYCDNCGIKLDWGNKGEKED